MRADPAGVPPVFRAVVCCGRQAARLRRAHGNTAMIDWSTYRDELKGRIGEIGKLSPDTVRGYATLSVAGARTQHLDARTRELIGLAVAVTTRCDGCITVQVDAALKHGASREEIAEALGVAARSSSPCLTTTLAFASAKSRRRRTSWRPRVSWPTSRIASTIRWRTGFQRLPALRT